MYNWQQKDWRQFRYDENFFTEMTMSFMVLQGKTYAVSTALNATKSDDLQQILLVLRKFKHILLTELVVD